MINKRKIYIKLDNPPTSIKSLIESLFNDINLASATIYKYAKPTYKNKECTIIDCNAGRRSFEDLYSLTTTYFPKATKTQLMKALMSISNLRWYICSDINKIVFHGVHSYLSKTITLESFLSLNPYKVNKLKINNTTQVKELINLVKRAEKQK